MKPQNVAHSMQKARRNSFFYIDSNKSQFETDRNRRRMPRTVKKDENLQPGKPLKPANLSERAAVEWDRLTGELDRAQIQVTAAHRAPLSMAATIAADIADAWAVVQVEGAYSTNLKTGAIQAHPASKRLDALRRDYFKVLTMLGLRTAVPGQYPDKAPPSLEDLLS